MFPKNMENSRIYAWRVDMSPYKFLITLGVFRYMNASYRTGLHRVIFKGPFHETGWFNAGKMILDWPIGCDIQLRYVDEGRPDNPDSGFPLVEFRSCVPVRSWIPHLVAGSPLESGMLVAYVDVECKALWTSRT